MSAHRRVLGRRWACRGQVGAAAWCWSASVTRPDTAWYLATWCRPHRSDATAAFLPVSLLLLRMAISRQHTWPTFIPLRDRVSLADLQRLLPAHGILYACDFYVTGAEAGVSEPGGWRLGRILNVDHHAPGPRMESQMTSTALAAAHVSVAGPVGDGSPVVLHHTDCDSMLSSAMLLGHVPPAAALVAASVAADHTGADDPVANLLQALDEERRGDRTAHQYIASLVNLRRLLAGDPIASHAQALVERRAARRAHAQALVASGDIAVDRGLAVGYLTDDIDGACFPALLPDAALIMLVSPHSQYADRYAVKLRLGIAAPPGLTLHGLGLSTFDPVFGGRWNAGSNKRGGGTALGPAAYAAHVRAALDACAQGRHAQMGALVVGTDGLTAGE
jgi:hypothetical protein